MTEPLQFARESCVGCGEKSHRHPYVAIMRAEDASKLMLWPEQSQAPYPRERFVALPVCELCWRDPWHRQRVLKAHFFPREQETAALAAAGSSSLG